MAWDCDVSIEEKVRQDCYNRGYEQGRKNPCDEIVAYIEELQNQVKGYQDKIEQGKMIELPCKVGDTIYWISSNNRDIIEAVVEKISFTKYDRVILLVEEKGVGEYSIPLVWDIFLTREEAEKRLKELQGDKR